MTKNEIFDNEFTACLANINGATVQEATFSSMDVYAKQECIALLKWLSLKEYDFSSYSPYLDNEGAAEFYNEFIENKNK